MSFGDNQEDSATGWRKVRKVVIATEKPVMNYLKSSIEHF
jgi:hypothetical protein